MLGTDLIKVALIYKPARVTPVGPWLTDANSVWSRTPLAQTFQTVGGERFSVVVNHFKAKGCEGASGANLDQGDGQGCYNARRILQAQRLAAWIAGTVLLGAGDPDMLIVGDLNADARGPVDGACRCRIREPGEHVGGAECLLLRLRRPVRDAGLRAGKLRLAGQTTGVVEWHANADEPRVLDYNEEFKSSGQLVSLYSPDAFRSSDHDPLLVELTLGGVGGGRKTWMPLVTVR